MADGVTRGLAPVSLPALVDGIILSASFGLEGPGGALEVVARWLPRPLASLSSFGGSACVAGQALNMSSA